MNKSHNKKYALIGVILFTMSIFSFFVYKSIPKNKSVVLQKSEEFFGIVNDGDIICRLGDRFWSRFFKDISEDDRRYSHVGVICVKDGRITVIHAEGSTQPQKDFVKEETLEDFIKIARAVGIYRINDIDGNLISNSAVEYLGVPFDWQFDMNDNSKLYCTELLYVIFRRVIPELKLNTAYIKEINKHIIPLDAISNSQYFTEIYFIDNIAK